MYGILRRAVISLSRPAISWVSAGLSMTHGPAIRKNGRWPPTSCPASFIDGSPRAPGPAACGSCAARCARAARMKPVNSGWPSRGVEVNSGWNWVATNHGWLGQLDHLHQAVAREAREAHARGAVALQVVVVELVAVAVALHDHVAAVRSRAPACRPRAAPPAPPGAWCRPSPSLVARLRAVHLVLPLGDQRDHRVRGGAVELGAVGVGQARARGGRTRRSPPACRGRCRGTACRARARSAPPGSCPRCRARRSRPAPGSHPSP